MGGSVKGFGSFVQSKAGFIGTTEECLMAYVKSNPDINKRKGMAEFIGVTFDCVQNWIKKNGIPQGENLLRLRYFLLLCGFICKELRNLQISVYRLGWMISDDQIAFDEACGLIDCPRDSLFRILLGRGGASEDRLKKINEVVGMSDKEFPVLSNIKEDCEEVIKVEKKNNSKSIELLTLAFASSIKSLTPIAEYLSSNKCHPEDRKRFREIAGHENVYKFLNALSKLYDEKDDSGSQYLTTIPMGRL